MKNIFIHGLGQNSSSWDKMLSFLDKKDPYYCPDLFILLKDKDVTYEMLYSVFSEYCNNLSEPLNLCGLSLGGILALNYTLDYPEKVNSLILIGIQYKASKILFKLQYYMNKITPESAFIKIGYKKDNFLKLLKSMKNLDFSKKIESISCKTLIICGKNDFLNIKAAKNLSINIHNAKLNIIENSGHMINIENPKKLSLVINEFYDK